MLMTQTVPLTTSEAADLLRRRPPTLERWRRQRIGPPFYRINGRVAYDRDDIEAWLVEQKRAAKAARESVAS